MRQIEAVAAQAGGFVEAHVLPGDGHCPHREHPDRTLAAMVNFLRREVLTSPAVAIR